MSNTEEQRKNVEKRVAKMNAEAVIGKLLEMEAKIDAQNQQIAQLGTRLAQLQSQMELQKILANQIAKFGSGATG